MKINIYYGGRGLIGDPTLCILSKIQEVLNELNVTINRYDLFEYKNTIPTLAQTLRESDGIILAASVEWFGIGGFMTQFLDACWLYGDKEKIKSLYMFPVAMSTTYGEKEALLSLQNAWEILGGLSAVGISGYILDGTKFEDDHSYDRIIEKRTEDLYRSINQKIPVFPCSNQAVIQKVSTTPSLNLTQEEVEQLSEYASDDSYVQKQKSDLQELASLFQDLMVNEEVPKDSKFINEFKSRFTPQAGFIASYKFKIIENDKPLIINVDGKELNCFYGDSDSSNVELQISEDVLSEIIDGRVTFQRAFMSGQMKMKGDFRILRNLDLLFNFQSKLNIAI